MENKLKLNSETNVSVKNLMSAIIWAHVVCWVVIISVELKTEYCLRPHTKYLILIRFRYSSDIHEVRPHSHPLCRRLCVGFLHTPHEPGNIRLLIWYVIHVGWALDVKRKHSKVTFRTSNACFEYITKVSWKSVHVLLFENQILTMKLVS